MAKFFTIVAGIIGVIVFSPLLLTGFGEFVMSIPFIGACMATLAGLMLRWFSKR